MGGKVQAALDALARVQLGLISRAQALDAGLSPHGIASRLAAKTFVPVQRRVYKVPSAPAPSVHQRALALCLSLNAVASHRTAAWLWRLDGFREPDTLDVTAGYGRHCALEDVRVHQRRNASTEPFTKVGVVPVTLLTRTLLDLTPLLEDGPLEVALDSAGRHRHGFFRELKEFLSTLPPRGVEGIQRLYDLVRLRAGDAPTGSTHETLVLQAVRRAGIEPPVTQHSIFTPSGTLLCIPDFAWPRKQIALFVDSRYHLGHRARIDQLQRLTLTQLGWKPVVVFRDLLDTRDWIATFAELFHVPL